MKFNKRVSIGIITIAVSLFIILLLFNNSSNSNDSKRFSTDYKNVPINNKFRYIDIDEVLSKIRSENAVIFIGFKDCIWCQDYAKYLNEAIIDTDISNVYYIDIYKIREKNSKKYRELANILKNYLPYDEFGNHQILVPATLFSKNGQVSFYDDETSYVSKDMKDTKSYWNDEKIKSFEERIKNYINNILDDK